MSNYKTGTLKYRQGEENIPLKYIQKEAIHALVLVYNLLDNDALIVEKKINYSDLEDRKWLGRITHYALTNHCSVETIACVDAEVETTENK
jgi:hypothetical protein